MINTRTAFRGSNLTYPSKPPRVDTSEHRFLAICQNGCFGGAKLTSIGARSTLGVNWCGLRLKDCMSTYCLEPAWILDCGFSGLVYVSPFARNHGAPTAHAGLANPADLYLAGRLGCMITRYPLFWSPTVMRRLRSEVEDASTTKD